MKEIKLTQGKVALVDDEDFEWLNQWKWHAKKDHNGTYYACRNVVVKKGKYKKLYMHRLIMNAKPGEQVDHIDHNGLNDQKQNLRIATHQQNQRNQKPHKNTSSKFKGVCWDKRCGLWKAYIRFENKLYYLGVYDFEIEAALAYDAAALKYFGDYAHTNILNK